MKKTIMPKISISEYLQSFAILFFPMAVIFFIIPFELYYNAMEYWHWNKIIPVSFVAIGLGIYVTVSVLLYIVSRYSVTAFHKSIFVIFFIGLYVFLADVFSPLQTGLLDGRELVSDEPLFYTGIEIALFFFVVFFAYKLHKVFQRLAIISSALVFLMSLGYIALISTESAPVLSKIEQVIPKPKTSNVYHIVLDEMQSDFSRELLNDKNISDAFNGFTRFENNLANYIFTDMSMPSYLTGRSYEGIRYSEWADSYKDTGIFRAMFDQGYEVNIYAAVDKWCSQYSTTCRSLENIYKDKTGIVGSDIITFTQIWVARITPNYLSNYFLQKGKNIGEKFYNYMLKANQNIPLTLSSGKGVYASVLMLDDLLETEASRSSEGNYIYAHAVLPHGPYVMNAECLYDKNLWRNNGGGKAYFSQSECGLHKVVAFINELKRLGRYDQSIIVLHSDTGHGHQGLIARGEGSLGDRIAIDGSNEIALTSAFSKPEKWFVGRTMALLMIKPSMAAGALKASSTPTQLIDLYPTILGLLGVEIPSIVDGVDVYSVENSQIIERPRTFIVSDPMAKNVTTTFALSAAASIAESKVIRLNSTVNKTRLDHSYLLDVGDNKNAVLFSAFYPIEHNKGKTDRWRWGGVSKTANIDFSQELMVDDGEYEFTFHLEPFSVNVDKDLVVNLAGQRRVIRLAKGMNAYAVKFDLTAEDTLNLDINYAATASPMSLGLGDDRRELSVKWSSIVISKVNND